MMSPAPELIEVVAPSVQLVTRTEAKAACRVLHDDENDYIDALIAAASEWIDGPFSYLGRAYRAATWTARWPVMPTGNTPLALPFGPVNALVKVRVHNGTSLVDQVNADYLLIKSAWNATIEPIPGVVWPVGADRRDVLQIEFTVGLNAVPAAIKQAALLQIAQWFHQREALDGVRGLSPQVENLLVNHRQFA